jgi:hypothetical protein
MFQGGELDNQNRIFAENANQHDHGDLRVNVVFQAHHHQEKQGAEYADG